MLCEKVHTKRIVKHVLAILFLLTRVYGSSCKNEERLTSSIADLQQSCFLHFQHLKENTVNISTELKILD